MALNRVAPEILLEISNYVDHEDLRKLCAVSHRLMSTFQRQIYSTIELNETSRSGSALLALASGPRRDIVREIRYKPHHPWPARDRRHKPEIKLSDETRAALQSLTSFPSLDKFQFDLSHWELSQWALSPQCLNRWEFHRWHGKHDTEPWRVLIEGSLLALSKSAGSFSRLEIDSLPPTGRETYRACESETWKGLLKHLTSFEMTLAGVGYMGDGGSYKYGKMTTAHQGFITLFPEMFLENLHNVLVLRLTGKMNAVIGNEQLVEPIDWASLSINLPYLTTFELDYSQISHQLVGFLSNHTGTLEKISLRNCIAPAKQVWINIINLFLDRQPKQLVEFTTTTRPVHKRIGDPFADHSDGSDVKMRRFVVGLANHDIIPIEEWAAVGDHDPELDESDVFKLWDQLEEMLDRNRCHTRAVLQEASR
ncbi:uncharacterized protein BKA55DRAFT_563908 [Fusarium redolens]|uniref:F-box domain-containing protein n=1 Tax=Fusarium redolens TaxID=48865 RepID=A0A9P9HDB0_FUSRE|nr:uncharacterized protein BKA55DRAFT_563908 [Fusarium redolens]KAH7255365.1 hypothetical protein BKA55DRAFT_563908 [Fusarium redolens]